MRAYFRRDAPAHITLDEVAEEHVELLQSLGTRDESSVLPVLEAHIRNHVIFGGGDGERRMRGETIVIAATPKREDLASQVDRA